MADMTSDEARIMWMRHIAAFQVGLKADDPEVIAHVDVIWEKIQQRKRAQEVTLRVIDR